MNPSFRKDGSVSQAKFTAYERRCIDALLGPITVLGKLGVEHAEDAAKFFQNLSGKMGGKGVVVFREAEKQPGLFNSDSNAFTEKDVQNAAEAVVVSEVDNAVEANDEPKSEAMPEAAPGGFDALNSGEFDEADGQGGAA